MVGPVEGVTGLEPVEQDGDGPAGEGVEAEADGVEGAEAGVGHEQHVVGGEGGDQVDAGAADTLSAEGDYAGTEALDTGDDYAAADDFGGDLGGDFGGGEL